MLPENFKISNSDTQIIGKMIYQFASGLKQRYVFLSEDDYTIGINSSVTLSIPSNENDESEAFGKVVNNIINIEKKSNCLLSIQFSYRWLELNALRKFTLQMIHNENSYSFTAGFDSFSNRLNIYNNKLFLYLNENDTIYFKIDTRNNPLRIENFILVFEEV